MYSNYKFLDGVSVKERRSKPSLAVINDQQVIKSFAKKKFDYILSVFEDKNVEGFIKNECYIAGGCLRNFIMSIPVNDIDIFFKSNESALFFRNLFEERKNDIFKKDYLIISETKNALTMKYLPLYEPFQFVIKEAGKPASVVYKTFDFQNCMGWYDPATDELDIAVMLDSLDRGELIYNQESKNPLNSIKRLIKFQKMGFEITEKCLFDMFKQSKDRTSVEQFNEYKIGTRANY